ncbi:very short patch repair endonuclease [Candidatus Poriferisocius sp.]|uniref:very short patch repair endonuclease n=1 Tax=Candidatus Poriferisocius sp. TaxID=3101276 RepID=UPI003B025804
MDHSNRKSVSSRMSRQRTRDTEPEMVLRRELHRRGLRYRVGYPVPGNPRRSIDIAFVGLRLAVFVDGCFWHGCPTHGTWPRNNAEWWKNKIEANRRRDTDTDRLLREGGWEPLRLWEHEIVTAADRVQMAYIQRLRSIRPRAPGVVDSPPLADEQPQPLGR